MRISIGGGVPQFDPSIKDNQVIKQGDGYTDGNNYELTAGLGKELAGKYAEALAQQDINTADMSADELYGDYNPTDGVDIPENNGYSAMEVELGLDKDSTYQSLKGNDKENYLEQKRSEYEGNSAFTYGE